MVTDLQRPRNSARGFTLVELLIGATISGVITLGVITSFTFLGRNMVRIANNSELQSRAAFASATVQKDVANTEAVVAVSSSGMTLTVDTGAGTDTYAYDSNADEITRADSSHTYVLLRKVTATTFTFSDSNGNTTTTPTSVKKIELDATTAAGVLESGTYDTHELVSPAMIVAGSSL